MYISLLTYLQRRKNISQFLVLTFRLEHQCHTLSIYICEYNSIQKYIIEHYTGGLMPYNKFRSCSKLVVSVTEHLVEVVDKLSTTAVVFFRSERILKCKCLYGA